MGPLILKGSSAFSESRLAALLKRLRAREPGLAPSRVAAAHVYLLDREGELSGSTMAKVHGLLGGVQPGGGEAGFFVTPRKGTISPWSSKATDIFRNCRVDGVRRVEHGVHYRICDARGRVAGPAELRHALSLLHDRMTEGVYTDLADIFEQMEPSPFAAVALLAEGRAALRRANVALGLALSDREMEYLAELYRALGRDPTDAELVMFGQVNSEHCRHKIFNAAWNLSLIHI